MFLALTLAVSVLASFPDREYRTLDHGDGQALASGRYFIEHLQTQVKVYRHPEPERYRLEGRFSIANLRRDAHGGMSEYSEPEIYRLRNHSDPTFQVAWENVTGLARPIVHGSGVVTFDMPLANEFEKGQLMVMMKGPFGNSNSPRMQWGLIVDEYPSKPPHWIDIAPGSQIPITLEPTLYVNSDPWRLADLRDWFEVERPRHEADPPSDSNDSLFNVVEIYVKPRVDDPSPERTWERRGSEEETYNRIVPFRVPNFTTGSVMVLLRHELDTLSGGRHRETSGFIRYYNEETLIPAPPASTSHRRWTEDYTRSLWGPEQAWPATLQVVAVHQDGTNLARTVTGRMPNLSSAYVYVPFSGSGSAGVDNLMQELYQRVTDARKKIQYLEIVAHGHAYYAGPIEICEVEDVKTRLDWLTERTSTLFLDPCLTGVDHRGVKAPSIGQALADLNVCAVYASKGFTNECTLAETLTSAKCEIRAREEYTASPGQVHYRYRPYSESGQRRNTFRSFRPAAQQYYYNCPERRVYESPTRTSEYPDGGGVVRPASVVIDAQMWANLQAAIGVSIGGPEGDDPIDLPLGPEITVRGPDGAVYDLLAGATVIRRHAIGADPVRVWNLIMPPNQRAKLVEALTPKVSATPL